MYSSAEFTELAEDCKRQLNQIVAGKPEQELARLEEIIVKTSLFEYMFWDMSENLETWPIEF